MKKSKLKEWIVDFLLAMGVGMFVPGLLLLALPPDGKPDDMMWGAWLLVLGFLSIAASFAQALLEDLKGEDK